MIESLCVIGSIGVCNEDCVLAGVNEVPRYGTPTMIDCPCRTGAVRCALGGPESHDSREKSGNDIHQERFSGDVNQMKIRFRLSQSCHVLARTGRP